MLPFCDIIHYTWFNKLKIEWYWSLFSLRAQKVGNIGNIGEFGNLNNLVLMWTLFFLFYNDSDFIQNDENLWFFPL